MSMYIPEIKEEVSENAKMLVEDGGKIVRTRIPSSGNGNSYDAIIKYDKETRKEEILHGSYDAIGAKMQAGEYVNVLVYSVFTQYNIYYGIVKQIQFDDEGYYIRVTCDIPGIQIENKDFFIYQAR